MDEGVRRLNSNNWSALILRWCPLDQTPEVRLMAELLGRWIADALSACPQCGSPNVHQFEQFAEILGIDSRFLHERIEQSIQR